MLSTPDAAPIAEFASQRIRAAEVCVELINRTPARVIRTAFFIIEFDEKGALKAGSLMKQAAAALDAALAEPGRGEGNVVDAGSRFIVKGGRWQPAPALRKLIVEAALGEVRCPSV